MGKHTQKSVTMLMKILGPQQVAMVEAFYRTIDVKDIDFDEFEADFVVYGKLPTKMADLIVKGK